MQRFRSLFGFGGGPSSTNPPWMHGPSIAQHIRLNLDPTSGKLLPGGMELPDEPQVTDGNTIRWAAGAKDGAIGHHFSSELDVDLLQKIAAYVREIARRDAPKAKLALYECLLDDEVLSYIDPLIDAFVVEPPNPHPYLHVFFRLLAEQSPDRGPVKFAIAMLGFLRNPADLALISLLGRHDEFTLYAAVALSNMLDHPEHELWRLAQVVDGWGRIQLVERLAETADPQIKDWMLREGFRNSVMNEYLAYTCAVCGELHVALADPQIDAELLDAAGEIIQALISGGPAEDINDYSEAAVVVHYYMAHVVSAPRTLQRLIVVGVINEYLHDPEWNPLQRAENGWTPQIHVQLRDLVVAYISEAGWSDLVAVELQANDERRFGIAAHAARMIGFDTWDIYWQRVQAEPRNERRWFPLMQQVTPERIELAIALALRELPLDQLGSGPRDELGVGPTFGGHYVFDAIVPRLAEYPLLGWPIVAAALRSPVIRHRHQALRTIAAWQRNHWTTAIIDALHAAAQHEPVAEVQAAIARVLNGESPDILREKDIE